jgi:hypothetical protein
VRLHYENLLAKPYQTITSTRFMLKVSHHVPEGTRLRNYWCIELWAGVHRWTWTNEKRRRTWTQRHSESTASTGNAPMRSGS